MILAGVKWQICLLYLDDVIVFSRSPEEHLQHLDEVLTRLGKAGVTLKAAKCHLFQNEVEYLAILSGRDEYMSWRRISGHCGVSGIRRPEPI